MERNTFVPARFQIESRPELIGQMQINMSEGKNMNKDNWKKNEF